MPVTDVMATKREGGQLMWTSSYPEQSRCCCIGLQKFIKMSILTSNIGSLNSHNLETYVRITLKVQKHGHFLHYQSYITNKTGNESQHRAYPVYFVGHNTDIERMGPLIFQNMTSSIQIHTEQYADQIRFPMENIPIPPHAIFKQTQKMWTDFM